MSEATSNRDDPAPQSRDPEGESDRVEPRRDAIGRDARSPLRVPLRGWLDVLWRVGREIPKDRLPMVASSLAFYAILALCPALVATVSLYGLLADPHQIANSVARLSQAMPWAARALIIKELNRIVSMPNTGLTLGLVGSIVFALLSASSGLHGLINGVTMAYDEPETRGFVRQRLLALGFAVGVSLFVVFSVAVLTVLPGVMHYFGLRRETQWLFSTLRWPALAVCVMVELATLYRYAPNRTPARWPWVMSGAALATGIWLLASYLLSLYVANFSRLSRMYGALGAIIILLLWFYVSALAILLGAEINAELERQTTVDTTIGPERPMGQRGAVVADTLGASLRGSPGEPLGRRLADTARNLVRPGREKSALGNGNGNDNDNDDDDND